MKNYILFILAAVSLSSCQEKDKNWQLTERVELDGVNPIGIASSPDGIWLSDGDHNRVVRINKEGAVVQSLDELARPMHISDNGWELLIPEYGNDQVLRGKENVVKVVAVSDSLDAPAAAWTHGTITAVADFYNHRVLYSENNVDWKPIGKKGKGEGEFDYPTDVQVTDDAIWVADAYNNRVQVFDKQGEFLRMIGVEQKMNAATGIYVSESQMFVTDFENDRVLVFDHQGVLQQEISEGITKPTDVLLIDETLYIVNYRDSSMALYDLKEVNTSNSEEAHKDDHDDHDHE